MGHTHLFFPGAGPGAERRERLLSLLLLASLAAYLAVTFWQIAVWAEMTDGRYPVRVTIEGDADTVSQVSIGFPKKIRYDDDDPLEAEWPQESLTGRRFGTPTSVSWQSDELLEAVFLHLPLHWRQHVTAVTVDSGSFHQRFAVSDLANWPVAETADTELVPGTVTVLQSPDGLRDPATALLNRANRIGLGLTATGCALAAGLCLALLLWPYRFRAERLLADVPKPHAGRADWLWPGIGIGLLLAALVALETIDPFYFTQDDNFSQFLPYILFACDSLAHGVWPAFNPYQFAGAPLASVGTYAVGYPGLWVSYGLAAGVLGTPTATLEVFAGLHLLGGYAASYALGRRAGLIPAAAAAVALSFVLCGYFLVAGRSWFYMMPLALWFPLLLLSVLTLERTRRPLLWAAATGLVIGLFFHAGNAQMWVYGLSLWGLAMLWQAGAGRINWRRLVWAAGAVVMGLGLALPLLLPQAAHATGIKRVGGIGYGIWSKAGDLFFPAGLFGVTAPNGSGEQVPQLYYSGSLYTILGVAAALAFLGLWCRWRLPGQARRGAVWAVLGLLALLIGLGHPATLWVLLAKLPGFKYFNIPLKLLPMLALLLNLGGALAAQSWFGRRTWTALAVAVMVLVTANALTARQSLYSYGADPYPPLIPQIADRVRPPGDALGPRVLAVSPYRSPLADLPQALGQNYPTVYRVPAFGGYDPLVEDSFEDRALYVPLKYDDGRLLRAFGVRWLLYHHALPPIEPVSEDKLSVTRWPSRNLVVGAPVLETGDATLYDLGPPSPIAFRAEAPEAALPARFEAGRVVVDLPPHDTAETVVLNFVHRARYRVTGGAGEVLEIARDPVGRIAVTIPAGVTRLSLSYDDGTGRALVLGALLCLIGLAGTAAAARFLPVADHT